MPRSRRLSKQTISVLDAMGKDPAAWFYGLELAGLTGLKSGSLYPILIRCAERGLLESKWLDPLEPGRPSRHAYRILPAGQAIRREAGADRASFSAKVQPA